MEDLSEEMKIDYNVVRRIMPVLVKKGIVCKYQVGSVENPKLKVKGFICNPWIYLRGVAANRTVISIFEHSGWLELIENQENVD
jgi:hypothetical protein